PARDQGRGFVLPELRRCPAVRRPRPTVGSTVPPGSPGGGSNRRDLPAPGWNPAGDRTRGRANAGDAGAADRETTRRPLPPADRWQPHGTAAAADPERRHRLELRPALGTRAPPPAPAVGLRRRLDARGGGSRLWRVQSAECRVQNGRG